MSLVTSCGLVTKWLAVVSVGNKFHVKLPSVRHWSISHHRQFLNFVKPRIWLLKHLTRVFTFWHYVARWISTFAAQFCHGTFQCYLNTIYETYALKLLYHRFRDYFSFVIQFISLLNYEKEFLCLVLCFKHHLTIPSFLTWSNICCRLLLARKFYITRNNKSILLKQDA